MTQDLVIYPGALQSNLAQLLAAYQAMADRGMLPENAMLRATVHVPRSDRPMYVWLLHSAVGPVGEVSLYNVDFFSGTAEAGIYMAEDCPRYVGVKAFANACHYAYNELGLQKLEAYVRVSNAKAVKAAKKFGFRQEGVLRRAARTPSGKYEDVIAFGLLKEEFYAKWGVKDGGGSSVDRSSSGAV